jgi:hypothetical protein
MSAQPPSPNGRRKCVERIIWSGDWMTGERFTFNVPNGLNSVSRSLRRFRDQQRCKLKVKAHLFAFSHHGTSMSLAMPVLVDVQAWATLLEQVEQLMA